MSKIIDPDQLSVKVNGTATTEEIEINTGTKTLKLLVNGNLNDLSPGKTSGVTGKAMYSFFKEEWLNGADAATLRRFKFPIKMIFEGSFIVTNGWTFADQQSRDLVRDAGFQDVVGATEWACMISLGSMDAPSTDLAYHVQAAGFTATTSDFDKTGELNENVNITGANTYFKAFLREQGKLYGEYNLLDEQGIASLGFQAYSFPLENDTDLKVSASDVTIDGNTPYTNMEINYIQGQLFETAAAQAYLQYDVVQDGAGRWAICTTAGTLDAAGALDYTNNGGTGTFAAYFGEELIGSTYYAFNRELDAGTGTEIEAHEFAQRQLRQTGNINDDTGITVGQDGYGTVNGEVARQLTGFVGDDLFLEPGVVIRNFDANSTNRIKHQPITVDSGGLDADDVPLVFTTVAFPFVAAGSFVFSDNLVSQPDIDTVYTVYFDYTKILSDDTGIAFTSSTGSVSTITGAANLPISAGEYFTISGATDPENNGLWLETGGSPTASSVTATKQDGATVQDAIAGDSITIKVSPFESPGAVIVQENDSTPMDAQVSAASIAWDFDYTNNNQGGRTANSPAPCTIVAIAKDGAEWTEASFTITAATGITVPVNANDERNYENV
jgi:hypothetical protein